MRRKTTLLYYVLLWWTLGTNSHMQSSSAIDFSNKQPGAIITPQTNRNVKDKPIKANPVFMAYLLELPAAALVFEPSPSKTSRPLGMSVARSGNVKFPASWASNMQKSQSILVVVVPLSTQHLRTMSHMPGRAVKPVIAKVSHRSQASLILQHKHPSRINSPPRHNRRVHMSLFGLTPWVGQQEAKVPLLAWHGMDAWSKHLAVLADCFKPFCSI